MDGNFRANCYYSNYDHEIGEKMLRRVISLFLADPTINWNNFKTRDNKRDSYGTRDKIHKSKSLINVMNQIHCITKDNEELSETEYLDHLLETATDPRKLAKMWKRWVGSPRFNKGVKKSIQS